MTKYNWIFVIEEKELKENSTGLVFPNGIPILLIRKVQDEIYAVSNKCAHMACPLSAGVIEGYTIKCPCHDWMFDIRTGEFLDAKEIKIPVFEWKLEDGKIFIKMKEGTIQ
jgi:nitrite reductase/ring-hydroxylating ferredoxin subunit